MTRAEQGGHDRKVIQSRSCPHLLCGSVRTIPLSSFCSFALLFLYTCFALVFFLFSQLLGLQVKANSVEFAGSFPIQASQDLTVVLLNSSPLWSSASALSLGTKEHPGAAPESQLNVPASSPAGNQGSQSIIGMPCRNASSSATNRPGSSAPRGASS